MKLNRRQSIVLLGSAAATLPLTAYAQAYPSRPITIVVPYPPGASSDQTARLVARRMTTTTGQPVVVENRSGANGDVGAAYVAKSPADGYRILLATQPIVSINPFLYKDMGFDPNKELIPVTAAVNAVVAIAVHPSLPVNNVAELIAWAKRNPGQLNFGTAGTGSPQHIGGLLFAQAAGIDMTHIPYKGGGPMVTDLLAGHIKMGIATLSVFKPLMADGKVKVLAVGEKTRFPGTPNVPTIAETLPGFELTTWLGFFAPAGTPQENVRYLSNHIAQALNSPEVKATLLDSALPVRADGPEELARLVRSDQDQYGRIIRDHKITAD